MREARPLHTVVAAVIVAAALMIGTGILGRSLVRVKTTGEIIRVIGSARKSIRSDFILWKGHVTEKAPTMEQAYAKLKADMDKVNEYLVAKGLPASEIVLSAIDVKTLYAKTKSEPSAPPLPAYDSGENPGGDLLYRPMVGYQLFQNIEVRSNQVDLVDRLSRQSTELISKGVPFASEPPLYLYTKTPN